MKFNTLSRWWMIGVLLVLPLSAGAASVAQTLTTPDTGTVTRGDFIRAAIEVLEVPAWKGKLPYTRSIPAALQPYITSAYGAGALSVFGKDLNPARGITRGEAAQVIVLLEKLSPTGRNKTYTDASKGSTAENAYNVVVQRQWMKPLRATLFGADRPLIGRDARVFLQRVIGESMTTTDTSSQAITITLKGTTPVALPHQDELTAIWKLLNDQYLYKDKLDGDQASYKAAQAMVESLKDPYTLFMPPEPAADFRDQLQGEVTGIGAQVEFKSNILTIVSPLPGSPALAAGLKAGDQILKVDGVDLSGLGFLESVNKVRGPKGSTATLTIKRNDQTMNIAVMRDTISVPEITVSWQGSTAILQIAQFGQKTDDQIRTTITDIMAKHPSGLIIDLRNDPGGLLDAADEFISAFLPKGSVVAHIAERQDEYNETTKEEPIVDIQLPMVVLINKGSASASEIVSGALQDAKRATIVGEQSFGKGTVQQVLDFRDGSSLKMTIAEWFTPLHHKIDGKGLTPDVVVPAVDGRDDQLLKALDIVR